tara:strand:- start:547 stop:663 length:117 start_codon:yes stop_codon:yes gene_type:complete
MFSFIGGILDSLFGFLWGLFKFFAIGIAILVIFLAILL